MLTLFLCMLGWFITGVHSVLWHDKVSNRLYDLPDNDQFSAAMALCCWGAGPIGYFFIAQVYYETYKKNKDKA